MCHPERSVLALFLALFVGCQSAGSSGAGRSASAASAKAGGDVRAAILDLHEQHRKAYLNKDAATLDRIWTDDFVFINYRGQLLSKAQRLDNLRSGATSFKSIEFTDEVVRDYGDAAVLIGVVTLEGQYSGEEGNGAYRFTSICSRRSGQWQIAALQMTRIEK
jgi:ketosteroid isomerase-like protein